MMDVEQQAKAAETKAKAPKAAETKRAPKAAESKRAPKEAIAHGAEREFLRAENEDDDGYDPYSDRRPTPEPLFERDPWA